MAYVLARETNPKAQRVGEADGPLDTYFNTMRYEPPPRWRLTIPYWLILLAIAIPWSALLAWRARRKNKELGTVGTVVTPRNGP